MINIFLDTSEYYGQGYDFGGINNSALLKLVNACKNEIVTLYIDNIVKNEIINDLKNTASEQKALLKTLLTKGPKREFLQIFPLSTSEIREKLNAIENESVYINEFNKFLEETKCKSIDFSKVSVKQIFDNYFNHMPPFSHKSEKKHEFPDAFSICSVVEFIGETQEMVVVSRDKDWKASLTDNNNVIFFDSLNKALNYVYTSDDIIPAIEILIDSIIDERQDEIKELVSDEINNMGFYVDDADGEFIEILGDIEFDDVEGFDILSMDENSILISAEISTEMLISYNLLNEGNSMWDNEEGNYFIADYDECEYEFKEYVYFEMKLDIDSKEIEIDKVNNNKDFVIIPPNEY